MKKHFAVFSAGRLTLIQGGTVVDAMQRFIANEHPDVTQCADGSVLDQIGRRRIRYAHPVAFLEARYKTCVGYENGGWELRELPEWVWEADYVDEVVVLPDVRVVEQRVSQCRQVLRRELPRSRARAFVWHLRDGPLVTFYRRVGPWEIDVVRRYLVNQDLERQGELFISPWVGGYDEIAANLWLTWLPAERPAGWE